MGCNSDYLNPSDREAQLQRTAKLLVYVLESLKVSRPAVLKEAAADQYCKVDFVAELCGRVRTMSEEQMAAIVWDGRKAQARDLADWWEAHEAADRERAKSESKKSCDARLRESALAKLTAAEKRALGL